MVTINGIRNEVAPRTVISVNGGAFVTQNGVRQLGYDKWSMVWNGNSFAPPFPGSVLYYPGIPGFGSTIFDFSHNMLDSAINTNEALDDSETGVDVTPDGTTALPAGSVIRVEEERMFVSATGNTLTVIRGFENSVAVSHDTGKDIYKRTKNDGAITGALWKQFPTGLWYLDYDGADDKATVVDSYTPTGDFYYKAWFKVGSGRGESTSSKILFKNTGSLTVNVDNGRPSFRVLDDGPAEVDATDTNALIVDTWVLLVGTFDSADDKGRLYRNVSGVMTLVATSGAIVSGTLFDGSGTDWGVGNNAAGTRAAKGGIAIPDSGDGLPTLSEIGEWFQQERHLFGV